MISLIKEVLEIIFSVIWNYSLAIGKVLYHVSGIPTSHYGLVKFVMEKNIVIFNSEVITKVIMFIVPFIVSHVSVYLCDGFRIRAVKEKEIVSTILYIFILYLFSLWQFWLVVGIVVLFVLCITIILNIRMKKTAN